VRRTPFPTAALLTTIGALYDARLLCTLTNADECLIVAEAEKVAFLLGLNCNDMIKCLVTPKVKVGTEWVTKGQSKDQVSYNSSVIITVHFDHFVSLLLCDEFSIFCVDFAVKFP